MPNSTAPSRSLLMGRRHFLAMATATAATPFIRTLSARAAAELSVTEVAPGVFVHMGRHEEFSPGNAGDISNVGFVIGKDGIAVIDTGGSPVVGKVAYETIRRISDRPIRYVINTHMHPDHVFGNVAFEGDNVTFVGHHKLPRALAARQERYLAINKVNLGDAAFEGTKIIMPNVTVTGRLELDLGDRKLALETQKTAHTDNDMTVRDLATDTLFMGDLLFVDRIPSIDGSIRGWLGVIDELSRVPAARVVPGHGPASVSWPDAAKPLAHYLSRIVEDVRAEIKQGRTMTNAMAEAAISEKAGWLLADAYHARNVSAAFAELEWE